MTLDCKTVVLFANVGESQYERSGASVKTARENEKRRLTLSCHTQARELHTRGSRLRRFAPSENLRNDCFAVYNDLLLVSLFIYFTRA